jgi:hypothetical protein
VPRLARLDRINPKEETGMALLYLLQHDVAVDEQGLEWTLDADGAWRPTAEHPRLPDLRLVWSAQADHQASRTTPVSARPRVRILSERLGA